MFQIIKRLTFWIALLGFGILIALVKATTSKPPLPEPLVKPAEKPFAQGIGASGIIEAMRENTSLGVAVPGLVMEMPVKVWDQVKAGDILIKLDDREVRSKLTAQEAELDLRLTELERARRQHERLEKLVNTRAIAREDYERKADDLPVAEAAVKSVRAAIRQTHELLDRFIVRAPLAATVLQTNTRVGEYIAPGATTPPMVLGSLEELQVRVDVDEQLAPRVEEGAKAIAYRKGDSTDPIELTFVRIEPYILPKKSLTGVANERVDTRVLQVIFRFKAKPGKRSYVGQQVDVFIQE